MNAPAPALTWAVTARVSLGNLSVRPLPESGSTSAVRFVAANGPSASSSSSPVSGAGQPGSEYTRTERVTSSGSLVPQPATKSSGQSAFPHAMFPQIFGKYVLEREIGAGGMARVFQATLRGAGGFEKRLVVKQI